jgi:hypothetical protein
MRRVWRAVVPRPLRRKLYELRGSYTARPAPPRIAAVPIDRLLLGDQGWLSASRFAQLTGRFLHPSTPIPRSPYAEFLREYGSCGDKVLSEEALPNTSYYQLLADSIRAGGTPGNITRREDIAIVAKHFLVDLLTSGRWESAAAGAGGVPAVEVRPVAHSDCFQIIDGHHRAAIAWYRGWREVPARVTGPAVLTPLQATLLDGMWLTGKRELYQPLDAPELQKEWTVVRNCADRFAMMRDFLQGRGLLPPPSSSYLDVGSAQGWFVKRMIDLGFDGYGVELDVPAAFVGTRTYGLDPSRIVLEELGHFLRQGRQFDVVSCLSVLHWYARPPSTTSPEEFVRLLGQTTRRVLFLETGGAHEDWHRGRLAAWTDDYVEELLRRYGSFPHVHRLGKDGDGVGAFEGSYNRTLFACCRERREEHLA